MLTKRLIISAAGLGVVAAAATGTAAFACSDASPSRQHVVGIQNDLQDEDSNEATVIRTYPRQDDESDNVTVIRTYPRSEDDGTTNGRNGTTGRIGTGGSTTTGRIGTGGSTTTGRIGTRPSTDCATVPLRVERKRGPHGRVLLVVSFKDASCARSHPVAALTRLGGRNHWVVAATARADRSGAFRFLLPQRGGQYRVEVTCAGHSAHLVSLTSSSAVSGKH